MRPARSREPPARGRDPESGDQAGQFAIRFSCPGRSGGAGAGEARLLAGAGRLPGRTPARAGMCGVALNAREGADLRLIVALTLATGLACASIAPPPGGPTDRLPPRLVAVVPDTMAVLADFDDEVEFQFDEVVAEGGTPNFGLGTGDLERLIILSQDRKSTRLNSSHSQISYAVFCLKKKKETESL